MHAPAFRPRAGEPWSASRVRTFGYVTLIALGLLCAWDASGLDLVLARWYGTPNGFPLRDAWLFSYVFHAKAQQVGWALIIGLLLTIRWPIGVLRRLSTGERAALVLSILASVLTIITLKYFNHSSCPWEMTEFGGTATYVSHWALTLRDGGPGQCFPGGHASTGFALLAAYFALHDKAPRAARISLVAALVAGFGLGWVQQIRGAHFLSHNLWTAWICWTLSGALDAIWRLVAARRHVRSDAISPN